MTSREIHLPVVSALTDSFVTELDASLETLMRVVGCKNVYPGAIPPLTTPQQIAEFMQVDDEDQSYYELWSFDRMGFNHESLTHGTRYSYYQSNNITIIGLYWKDSFEDSYKYIQYQTELVMRTLERNKKLITETFDPLIINQDAKFSWGNQGTLTDSGEIYLHRVELNIILLDERVESGGRAT